MIRPTRVSNTKPSSSSLKVEKQDDLASQSGSDDGSYAVYPDPHKFEAEMEEECSALTSQTLNPDGTPKRPMNAFMIFARRRRPQVSAENSSMRTGEISKLLSKEWVTMAQSDKQFYLEQAKQLKENFNSRYPDYVYRRRPNNSRKRRRSENALRPDQAIGDHGDEIMGMDIDTSPTEEEHADSVLPSVYHRSPYPVPQGSVEPQKVSSHTRGPSLPLSEPVYGSPRAPLDPRFPFTPSGHPDRMGTGLGSPMSPRVQGGMHYQYEQTSGNNTGPSIFGTDSLASHQSWQQRSGPSSWIGGPQDRFPPSVANQKHGSYPSTTSPTSWPASGDHGGAHHTSPSPNYFPTLNTPFYPNQQSPTFQSNIAGSSLQALPQQSSSSSYAALGLPAAREYQLRGYDTSSVPPLSYPPASGRDPLSYSQRPLPPVQYSTNSGHPQAPAGFWSRD